MKPELTQNLWERYGFRDNPFDTRALSMTPDSKLSVAQVAIKLKQFTNSSLARESKKSKQHVTKFINRFQKFNFIYQTSRESKSVYYDISPDLLICQ